MRVELRASGPSRAFGVLMAFCFSLASSAATADSWDTPDAKWRQGPAKYLLEKEEDQAYKKLKTDEERAKFVEEFWARRDPSPGTPENEYRVAYYRRAREAAEKFSEDGGKGWQDERGRAYLLLGPPDEMTSPTSIELGGASSAPGAAYGSGFGSTGSAIEAGRKQMKFVYHADPLTGKKGRFEITFESDAMGGYRLTNPRVDWSAPALRGLAHRPAPPPQAQAAPPAPAAAPPAPAPEVPQPAPALTPPPPEATPESELIAALRAPAPPEATLPLDLTANFYKAADASTFATLTLELKRSLLPASSAPDQLIIAAEILDATGASAQRFMKKEQFGGWEGNLSAGINDTLLYQAERPLEPGKYKAIFAIKDPASGAIGRLERDLDVPSYKDDAFALSTVTLARKLEPVGAAGTAAPAEGTHAFILGKYRVVPRPDNLYKEGEDLTFYYQIYGAAVEEASKQSRVDLSYSFEKKMPTGDWRMVGGRPVLTPGQSQLAQAFGLPLRGWPGGDYRVVVKVTDTIAGTTATAEVPFSIQGAGASKAKAKSKS